MVVQEGTITACHKNSFSLPDGEKVKITSKEELTKQVTCLRVYHEPFAHLLISASVNRSAVASCTITRHSTNSTFPRPTVTLPSK